MGKLVFGAVAGMIFGILDVVLMIPLSIPDKTTAMVGSFINRFAIGLLIATVDWPAPGWVRGLIIGLLLSLPDAIITKAYGPILGVGIVGGVIVGLIMERI